MSNNILKNRIDFVAIVSVDGANPNGDPLAENFPRQFSNGYGYISDVCLKHKMRARLSEMAEENPGENDGNDILFTVPMDVGNKRHNILLRMQEKWGGAIWDLLTGGKKNKKDAGPSELERAKELCRAWRDVRAFGYLVADKKADNIGFTGAVSVQHAKSVARIAPETIQTTKCISYDGAPGERTSDQMGKKFVVNNAAYVVKGSISCRAAERNEFTEEDAEAVKEAIWTMFDGDESSARPAGSMVVQELYWFRHNSKWGQYPIAQVQRSVEITPSTEYPFYKAEFHQDAVSGLVPEVRKQAN